MVMREKTHFEAVEEDLQRALVELVREHRLFARFDQRRRIGRVFRSDQCQCFQRLKD